MKLRKLIWLPLTVLLLNGCEAGKKVDTSVANDRVSEAIQAQEEMEVNTLTQEVKQNTTESIKQDSENGERTVTVINNGVTSLKAKELLGTNPEVAAKADATSEMYVNNVENAFVEVHENMYYVDGWFYNDYDNTVRGDVSFGQKAGQGKVKINVGAIDFAKHGVLAIFSELARGTVNFEPLNYSQILLIAAVTENVKARESGGVLTVTYNLTKDDFVRFIASQMAGIDYGDLTSEEKEMLDEIMATIIAQIEKGYEIRKYEIEVKIAKEGYITRVRVESDVTQTVYDPEDKGDNPAILLVAKSKGVSEINTKINEKVTIKFPDFSDYVEQTL